MIRDIKKGRRTVEEACVEMAKACTCGNFNLTRAAKHLREIAPLYVMNRY